MGRFDPRRYEDRTPQSCGQCGGTRFTRVKHWRGQAVEGGTAWGLVVRCDDCGALWSSRVLMSRFSRDEEMHWEPRGPGGASVSASGGGLIRFVFLTASEVEGTAIRWDEAAPKPPELVAAALAAGFSEWEVRESPVGVLEQDLPAAPWEFRRGARALVGMNGSTLIEVRAEERRAEENRDIVD